VSGLVHDLAGPHVDVVQTHISWVFLIGGDVYKVKKPVDLGFLDFTTLDRRRAACEAEVRLNRRLAEDVYLGVVPVTRERGGRYRLGGSGEVVDYAVHMRRLPDALRGDVRLRSGRLGTDHLRAVAERLARFHADQIPDDAVSAFGMPEQVEQNVRENFEQTRSSIGAYLSQAEAQELETWHMDMLGRHRDLFVGRVRAGRVRDGHGDLRLEHVYLDDAGAVTVLDCIEFNDRFRYGDVCSDVAFLSMDLAYEGRVDLSEAFLGAYAQAAGDYDLYRLVDFYESYRAHVRAKISSILASDEAAPGPARSRAAERARRYYLLALAAERAPLVEPVVVAVGGLIASGKSTLASRIGERMAAPVVDADRTRKQLLGAAPTANISSGAFTGAYGPEATERVYGEVMRRGDAVLASGRPVVLDASFKARAHREKARELAARHGVPFRFVECRSSPDAVRDRLVRRASRAGVVSDARVELLDAFAAAWEPVDELPGDEHLLLDTSGEPAEANLERVARWIPRCPDGLTA
jgi:uncharacterized protein